MMTNYLLNKYQHGFIRTRSRVTQLSAILDSWTVILDRSGSIDCIYLDFSKAFDSVSRRRMINKLVKGIKECFLNDRLQKASLGSLLSVLAPVISGKQQGSVLCPIVFIIFVTGQKFSTT